MFCTVVYHLFIYCLYFLFLQKCLIASHPFGKQKSFTKIILKVSSNCFVIYKVHAFAYNFFVTHLKVFFFSISFFYLFPDCSFDRELALYADDTCVVPEKLEGKALGKHTESNRCVWKALFIWCTALATRQPTCSKCWPIFFTLPSLLPAVFLYCR